VQIRGVVQTPLLMPLISSPAMLCEYTFAPAGSGDEARRELDDWVGALFSRYRKNGQVWGPVVTGWVEGTLRATFHVPSPDALDDKHQSKGVATALEKVVGLCKDEPAWRVVGEDDSASEGVGDAKALFLKTDMFSDTSPVFEGSEGTPVPLFQLPIDWHVRENLQSWMRRAQLHDELWINSGRLESVAYAELSDPSSALAGEGRELARTLEEVTGIATYYFLKHYWGRREADKLDVCPSCNEAWAAESMGTGSQGIDGFAYRCDTCRIVSEQATATSQED
jgi:predicted  nucleic acid-binding Zn ribbon protein